MKKLFILFSIAAMSCSKDCFLYDTIGNQFSFKGDIRSAWSEYERTGTTVIGGNTYNKTTLPLYKLCE